MRNWVAMAEEALRLLREIRDELHALREAYTTKPSFTQRDKDQSQ